MRIASLAATLVLAGAGLSATAADAPPKADAITKAPEADKARHLSAEESKTEGSVTAGGRRIDYQAIAGTLVVHPKGWDDAEAEGAKEDSPEEGSGGEVGGKEKQNPTAEAAMSFVAYIRKDAKSEARPLTFLYNGGPGSSTVWLHMGAFGPRRVVTADDSHSPAAPYTLVNNDYSLLDASDIVFVDAPGTGFGRMIGDHKEKAFWGVDEDAHAFADFISAFLTKYQRWNSPKYLFGESYGTTRSAVLINMLETDRSVDFNGVILLSQILNFDASADVPEYNPGVELPYELALPTYAATAWYHKKLGPEFKDLVPLLDEVQKFALGDYAHALDEGSALPSPDRQAIAEKLHKYTGLPVDYVLKADLRISGGEFEKTLQDDKDTTTGRLDTRFSGPTMDPLSKEADYDPQSAAISSAYVTVFNDYVRRELKFGEGKVFKPEIDLWKQWSWLHQPPNSGSPVNSTTNVMPDLASALKYNPTLKVMLNAGYYDLATPYFEGVYEMHHLPIPASLQGNIEYKTYESGHMVYAHEASLKALHDNVAAFIRKTDNLPPE